MKDDKRNLENEAKTTENTKKTPHCSLKVHIRKYWIKTLFVFPYNFLFQYASRGAGDALNHWFDLTWFGLRMPIWKPGPEKTNSKW